VKIKPSVPAPPGPAAGAAPILVGVSACLLGQRVRWDGGHKSDAFLTGMLGRYVQWVPLCPEVEVGLPVPRDTLRLVRRGERPTPAWAGSWPRQKHSRARRCASATRASSWPP
jgi:uncharacterized protein YbbK (DUF523 family)